jgi:glycosyltransferase involved in cell wall biosynthesis
MMNELRFSVIIPLYNKEKDIIATLKSLVAQTFQDFEIVIVDDGSTDRSAEAVTSFQDPRIRFFSKQNEGVAPTRNFGVNKALSDFVVFLDADDFWYSHHLADLNALREEFPNGKWFATAYEKKFHANLVVPMESPILKKGSNWKGIVDDYSAFSYGDCLAWTSAVCFQKDFFLTLGGFDTSITMGAGEDTDLWLRAALASPLVFTTKISATHNLEGSNRITLSPTLQRKFWNIDQFEPLAKDQPSLKKYLDISRYAIAIQYKMAGDLATAKTYSTSINPSHLNWKQNILISSPQWALKALYQIKKGMERLGWRTTTFEL